MATSYNFSLHRPLRHVGSATLIDNIVIIDSFVQQCGPNIDAYTPLASPQKTATRYCQECAYDRARHGTCMIIIGAPLTTIIIQVAASHLGDAFVI